MPTWPRGRWRRDRMPTRRRRNAPQNPPQTLTICAHPCPIHRAEIEKPPVESTIWRLTRQHRHSPQQTQHTARRWTLSAPTKTLSHVRAQGIAGTARDPRRLQTSGRFRPSRFGRRIGLRHLAASPLSPLPARAASIALSAHASQFIARLSPINCDLQQWHVPK